MLPARELIPNKPGYLYEPRVLWGQSVIFGGIEDDGGEIPGTISQFGRDDFYNGSRWPIVLTHMTALFQHPFGYSIFSEDIFAKIPVEIGLRGGVRYTLGRNNGFFEPVPGNAPTQSPIYVQETLPMFDSTAPNNTIAPRDVYNSARWDFEHPLVLPPAAFMEMNLSGRPCTPSSSLIYSTTVDTNFYASAPKQPAIFPATVYTQQNTVQGQMTADVSLQPYVSAIQSILVQLGEEGSTVILPTNSFADGPETQQYPPNLTFTSQRMQQQKSTYGVPTQLSGFSVAFQQEALDDLFPAQGSLATVTRARIRTRNGGTNAYWWRDGAPLAICTPTRTPAQVSKLLRPLTLQPNEGFRVAIPPTFDPNALRHLLPAFGDGNNTKTPYGVLFISFCGYAVIEA